MALIFSEAFESAAALLNDFWPASGRTGSSVFTTGRTNQCIQLPKTNETDTAAAADSYITFNFGSIGTQSNKRLFLGFAAQNFRTKTGASDGSFTERQLFLRVLDASGAVVVSFEFEKNVDPETVLKLVAVHDGNIVARYPLESINTSIYNSPTCAIGSNLITQSSTSAWIYFEWEFDLSAATPVIKGWVNGARLTDSITALKEVPLAALTEIGGFRLHGNQAAVCRNGTSATNESVRFDDLYISDNLDAEFQPDAATALKSRLGAAKIYNTAFLSGGAKFANWSPVNVSTFVSEAEKIAEALALNDGNEKYAASNILNAEIATKLNGPASISAFERVAAVQMIYSASAAGSLPAALMPVMDNSTGSGTNLATDPTVFQPDDGYVARVVTVQTDPITNAEFLPADVSGSGTRRIGLKVAQPPEET